MIYVGNEVILHGTEELHEQQIGTAVFGRSPSYDTSQDNIVRVNAMELRKRIDLYFAEEGKTEPLIFEIPRGSYSPVFRLRQQIANGHSLEEAPPAVEESIESLPPPFFEAPPLPPAGKRRPAFLHPWPLSLLFVIACLACWLAIDARRDRESQMALHKWQSGPALRAFWGNFFGQRLAPEIVLADISFGIAQDILHRQVSLAEYLDYSYRAIPPADPLSSEARQQEQKDLAVILDRSAGSVADFRVARRITELETGGLWNPSFVCPRICRPSTALEQYDLRW